MLLEITGDLTGACYGVCTNANRACDIDLDICCMSKTFRRHMLTPNSKHEFKAWPQHDLWYVLLQAFPARGLTVRTGATAFQG